MSIQNIKKVLFTLVISLFSFNTQAQIEKGATTLDGISQYDISKYTSKRDNFSSTGFSISPSYGRFITDKIMVKGQLNTTLSKLQFHNIGGRANNYKSNFKTLSIDAEVRYYFNPKAKWKVFGSASLGKSFVNSDYIIVKSGVTNNSNNVIGNIGTSTNTNKFDKINYSVFAGVNKFINSDIALEAKLGYCTSVDDIPLIGLAFLEKTHSFGFNLGLNNFTNFKTYDKNFEGLIDKGRGIIHGNLSINAYKDISENNSFAKSKGAYTTLDLEYGYFVTKGLLVGIKGNFIIEKDFKSYSVSPYVQYFYPILKRLMLHGLAEIQSSINQSNTVNLNFRGAAGFTYFLSKNVALSANLFSFSESYNRGTLSFSVPFEWKNRNLGSSVGIRFFLK